MYNIISHYRNVYKNKAVNQNWYSQMRYHFTPTRMAKSKKTE